MLRLQQVLTARVIKAGVFLAFLLCYIDWGHDGKEFIIQTEGAIIGNRSSLIQAIENPIIALALVGQLLLLSGIAVKSSVDTRSAIGIFLMSLVALFILVFSLFTNGVKGVTSVIPFFALAFLYFKWYRFR